MNPSEARGCTPRTCFIRVLALTAIVVSLASFVTPAAGDAPPTDWQVTGFGLGGRLVTDASVDFNNGAWDITTGRSRSAIVYHSVSGDISMVLQLTEATGQPNAHFGIMMWSSLAPTAGKAGLVIDPQGQKIYFSWDETSDRPQTYANFIQCEGIGFPVWLKLTRSGSYFLAFFSKDGQEWRPVGFPIKTFWAGKRPELYAGIYADGVCEERLTNLMVAAAPAMTLPEAMPSEWKVDIHGEPEYAGQAEYADGRWTLAGANAAGRGGYHGITVLKPVPSKVEISAKIQTSALDDPRVGGGLLLSAHGVDAGILAFPAGGTLTMFTRQTINGRILESRTMPIPSALVGQAEAYLRLALADGRLVAFYATDTNNWTQVGGILTANEMTADVAGGMDLLSGSASRFAPSASFEDVQVAAIAALPIAIPAGQVQARNFRPGYYYWPGHGQQPSDAKLFITWDGFQKQDAEFEAKTNGPSPGQPSPHPKAASSYLVAGLVIWSVIILVAITVVCAVPFNRLVYLLNRTRKAWAQIDVQLKRRHDLILNYVEVVKGYAKHESETLENVTRARTAAMNASTVEERARAESALNANMRSLNSVVEAYPNLKANQNFLSLQDNLTETEDKLATVRNAYNEEVLTYNTAVQSFPTNLVAVLFHFKVRDFFELKEVEQRESPKAGI